MMSDEMVVLMLQKLLPPLMAFMVSCFILFSVCFGFGISLLGNIQYFYRFIRKLKRVRRIHKLKGCK